MKLICIEEHAIDPAIAAAAQAALHDAAPYMALQNSNGASFRRSNGQRPAVVPMDKAIVLGCDLGQGRIDDMDSHAIDIQVVSYSTPAQLVPGEGAVALTQLANDRLAEAIRRNPTRLSGFATLPWQAPRAAADELDRCVNELGLKGVLIAGRPGRSFLDDVRYTPVLRKLNDLAAPIYVHPHHPLAEVQQPYYGGLAPEVTAQLSLGGWGWHHEAGVHVLRLILSGAFERFPNLQVISGHWGEMVPFYLQRLDDLMPPTITGLSRTIPETYMNNVWVTPSGMFDRPHFDFIYATIGADRLIWSVDYPYLTLDGARTFLEGLPIAEEDMHKIAHGNAERLFRL